jgi:sterol desaturase/sphingolipid hydroxylase (fatty acid hydroxylase superfamily)
MHFLPVSLRLILGLSIASLIVLEILCLRRRQQQGYDWRESAASFVIAVGQRLIGAVVIVLLWPLYSGIYAHRLFTFEVVSVVGIVGLFLGVEFFYYWEHRLSHRVRWLWATHSVHHSPEHLNLSAAYRLGWTALLSGGPLFVVPMMWLGFPPVAVLAMVGLNLLYQFWLHTELVPPLPGFDAIFNSPANHRVHHGSNSEYIDRNFGGVLVVFDRMFGTYTPESDDITRRYGLADGAVGNNPLMIVFREWQRMLRDLLSARTLAGALHVLTGPPR